MANSADPESPPFDDADAEAEGANGADETASNSPPYGEADETYPDSPPYEDSDKESAGDENGGGGPAGMSSVEVCVDQLNKFCQDLQADIQVEEVKAGFENLSEEQIENLFGLLEKNASKIRNPTNYLLAAARRCLADQVGAVTPDDQRPPRQKGGKNKRRASRSRSPGKAVKTAHLKIFVPTRAVPTRTAPRQAVEDSSTDAAKIEKRVNWLNDHTDLVEPLDFDRVGSFLCDVGLSEALDLLNNLEEQADKIRNPNGYVVNSARNCLKELEESGSLPVRRTDRSFKAAKAAPVPQARPKCSAKGSKGSGKGKSGNGGQPDAFDEKLQRRIEYINDVVTLNEPLVFHRIVAPLRELGSKQAMVILKQLQEVAEVEELKSPNGWVVAACRKARKAVTPIGSRT